MRTKLAYTRPQLVRIALLDGSVQTASEVAKWCGGHQVGCAVMHTDWDGPAVEGDVVVELPGHVFTAMNKTLFVLLVGDDLQFRETPAGSVEVRVPQASWWQPVAAPNA